MKIYNQLTKFTGFEKSKAGFAILFAVLLASFLITLGISIFSISLKEILITTSVRDSQIAFYTADSAQECAQYWDFKKGVFPKCHDSVCGSLIDINGEFPSAPNTTDPPIQIICNGNPVTLSFSKDVSNQTYISEMKTDFFKVSSTSLSAPVSDIIISTKSYFDNSNTFKGNLSTITAYGHNTGIIGRRVERGLTINI
jgi:hypothetical protein